MEQLIEDIQDKLEEIQEEYDDLAKKLKTTRDERCRLQYVAEVLSGGDPDVYNALCFVLLQGMDEEMELALSSLERPRILVSLGKDIKDRQEDTGEGKTLRFCLRGETIRPWTYF